MEKRKIKLNNFFLIMISVILALASLLVAFNASNSLVVHAADVTGVLEDLGKDEKFNKDEFPTNEGDISLSVIQIAESSAKELFIYVYSPAELDATSINFSTSIGDNFSPKNYKLKLIDKQGALGKYVVEDFQVLNDVVRYYSVPSIFRLWNDEWDGKLSEGQTGNERAFEVAKQWTAVTLNGQVSYTCLDIETVEITDKYVGFIRYNDGWKWIQPYTDSHFVAFSTDKPINKLMEADISFGYRKFQSTVLVELTLELEELEDYKDKVSRTYDTEEPILRDVTLFADESGGNNVTGWFAESYSWKRIQKASDFISDNKKILSDKFKDKLSSQDWVLRFCETDYTKFTVTSSPNAKVYGTEVSDVTILRLKFETDGVVYNLGVVDNKQTGPLTPSGETGYVMPDWLKDLLKWLAIGFAIIVGILLLIFIGPFIPTILSFIWTCIVAICKAIWWVITLPFKIFEDKK